MVKRLIFFQVRFDAFRPGGHLWIVFEFVDQLKSGAIEGMADLVRLVVADIIQQRIHRIGNQFCAVFPQPFGR